MDQLMRASLLPTPTVGMKWACWKYRTLCIPSPGQFRVYRVTELNADVVYCRESPGSGPVVLKAVRVTWLLLPLQVLSHAMDHFSCTSLSNTQTNGLLNYPRRYGCSEGSDAFRFFYKHGWHTSKKRSGVNSSVLV